MKKLKITVDRAHSEFGKPGVLIPEDAEIVDVQLDSAGEHGQVVFYRREVVDVDDEQEAASDDGR